MAKRWKVSDLRKPHMRQQAKEQLDATIKRKTRPPPTIKRRASGTKPAGHQRTLNLEQHVTIMLTGVKIHSLNTIHQNHWRWRVDLKREYMNAIMIAGMSGLTPPEHPVHMHITRILGKHEKQYDHDNLVGGAKTLIDALVDSGWAKDDSNQWLDVSYHQEARYRPKGPAIRIVIWKDEQKGVAP